MRQNRIPLFTLLVLSLFLFSSCELLNPIIGSSTNKIAPNPSPHNFQIAIERTENAIQGQPEQVEITLHNFTKDQIEIGRFDLLVTYDASALTFQSAEPGEFIEFCGWSYFTYWYGYIAVDSINRYATVRIIAFANVGPNPPVCYNPNDSTSYQLAVLNFLVTNDRNYECSLADIKFVWGSCSDNMLYDITGNLLFASEHIYRKTAENTIDYSQDFSKESLFPSTSGYNNYPCDSIADARNVNLPNRNIDFINGGIDIVCVDSIDTRCNGGDLNNNGNFFEIADAVLYSNYFVYGMAVFTVNPDCQIEASDVNGDGLTLTVVDFVHLIKILIGDSIPVPNTNPIFVNGKYFLQMNRDINILNDLEISAAHIILEGNIIPTLLADSMTMIYNYDGTNTNILIYSLENHYFTGSMINIGNGQIVSINMVDLNGSRVVLNSNPSFYLLGQNYPNPFSTLTYIDITLPIISEVTFEVRNSSNEIVYEFTKSYNSGIHQIVFDGSELDTGTYSYSIQAGDYEHSKTMEIVR